MPIVEQSDINWAKEIDEKDTEIELSEEGDYKKVIEYKTENDKRYKVTNIFKIEKVKVSKTVAERKEWRKFGDSANDGPGLNPATTVVSDDVQMQFLSSKEETDKVENVSAPVPSMNVIKCRFCKGDHWSAKCPHKDLLQDKIVNEPVKGIILYSLDILGSKTFYSCVCRGCGWWSECWRSVQAAVDESRR